MNRRNFIKQSTALTLGGMSGYYTLAGNIHQPVFLNPVVLEWLGKLGLSVAAKVIGDNLSSAVKHFFYPEKEKKALETIRNIYQIDAENYYYQDNRVYQYGGNQSIYYIINGFHEDCLHNTAFPFINNDKLARNGGAIVGMPALIGWIKTINDSNFSKCIKTAIPKEIINTLLPAPSNSGWKRPDFGSSIYYSNYGEVAINYQVDQSNLITGELEFRRKGNHPVEKSFRFPFEEVF